MSKINEMIRKAYNDHNRDEFKAAAMYSQSQYFAGLDQSDYQLQKDLAEAIMNMSDKTSAEKTLNIALKPGFEESMMKGMRLARDTRLFFFSAGDGVTNDNMINELHDAVEDLAEVQEKRPDIWPKIKTIRDNLKSFINLVKEETRCYHDMERGNLWFPEF